MSKLVLVRHGESLWNLHNRFSGWVDVPLSESGIEEAVECSTQLNGTKFDVAYTSELERAHATLNVILAQQIRTGVFQHEGGSDFYTWKCKSNQCTIKDMPIYSSELLNERYYGGLQGMKKTVAEKEYGKEQVFKWRRGYFERPPGGGESLEDAYKRMLPYHKKHVEKSVTQGKNVLLVGHGNTLRALMKHLEKISDEDMPFLDLPHGKPIVYSYKRKKWICENPDAYSFNRPLR